MGVLAGQVLRFDFTTRNPETLIAATPDPVTGVFVINGVDGASVTITEKDDGVLTVQGMVPLNTSLGAMVQIRAEGVISTFNDNWIIFQDVCSGAEPSKTNYSIIRGDTVRLTINGLGNLSSVDKIWFTLKSKLVDIDSMAVVGIESDTGLVTFKGATEASPALGSITVVDAANGIISVFLDQSRSRYLPDNNTYSYDVQVLDGSELTTRKSGKLEVEADVTRSIT